MFLSFQSRVIEFSEFSISRSRSLRPMRSMLSGSEFAAADPCWRSVVFRKFLLLTILCKRQNDGTAFAFLCKQTTMEIQTATFDDNDFMDEEVWHATEHFLEHFSCNYRTLTNLGVFAFFQFRPARIFRWWLDKHRRSELSLTKQESLVKVTS